MTVRVTETCVAEILAAQGVAVPPEAAKAIAAGLSAQLARAAAAYAALPFEAEPASFVATSARERP